jgi:hypothetical protein
MMKHVLGSCTPLSLTRDPVMVQACRQRKLKHSSVMVRCQLVAQLHSLRGFLRPTVAQAFACGHLPAARLKLSQHLQLVCGA